MGECSVLGMSTVAGPVFALGELPAWLVATVVTVMLLARCGHVVVTQVIRLRTTALLRPEDALPVLLAHHRHRHRCRTRRCRCLR